MTTPLFSNLEAIAIKNQLDYAYWTYQTNSPNKVQLQTLDDLRKRYRELVGEEYEYRDERGKFTD